MDERNSGNNSTGTPGSYRSSALSYLSPFLLVSLICLYSEQRRSLPLWLLKQVCPHSHSKLGPMLQRTMHIINIFT